MPRWEHRLSLTADQYEALSASPGALVPLTPEQRAQLSEARQALRPGVEIRYVWMSHDGKLEASTGTVIEVGLNSEGCLRIRARWPADNSGSDYDARHLGVFDRLHRRMDKHTGWELV